MRIKLPLREYNREQIKEILSDLNIWGTGEEHERSIDPAAHSDRRLLEEHWEKTGAHERFNERFEQEVVS